jgi:hypothetical protein
MSTKTQTGIKRLFWDIETSPNIVLSWRVGYKINLSNDNILKERKIICIGYKWEHETKSHVLTWDRDQGDKRMLEKFLKLANQADEMVAHNGDSFDLPWFLTRCAFHGIRTFPTYKTVDTLQWARRRFYFNSNKLNYLAQYLGIGSKIKTEFGLWKEVMLENSSKALTKMADYCAHDVVLLEKVWARLSALVPHKTHAGVLKGGDMWSCARCGSEKVKLNLTRVTARGVVQKQMQCKSCGGNYSISSASFERYKEAKHK